MLVHDCCPHCFHLRRDRLKQTHVAPGLCGMRRRRSASMSPMLRHRKGIGQDGVYEKARSTARHRVEGGEMGPWRRLRSEMWYNSWYDPRLGEGDSRWGADVVG